MGRAFRVVARFTGGKIFYFLVEAEIFSNFARQCATGF